MTDNNQPVHRIRLSTISAAIFQNQTADGITYYNAQFDRSYKDGDDWKHTRSFGRDDLITLGKVADMAHSWIHEQQASSSRHDQPSEPWGFLTWHEYWLATFTIESIPYRLRFAGIAFTEDFGPAFSPRATGVSREPDEPW